MSYLGPAGILSTGDPVQDEIQILEEQGPEDDLFEEEPFDTDYICGICDECGFRKLGAFFVGDKKDLEDAKEKLREQHRAKRPRCRGTLDFG